MQLLLALAVLCALVGAGVAVYRTFTPEIDRARRIRRAHRGRGIHR